MKGSATIGRVMGIKINIHWTFLILLAWVTLSGKTLTESWWSLAFIFTVFLCVVLHELGHAIAARSFGIKTLDITLLQIGGVARIEKIPEKPHQELLIALAGPFVNIVLAAALFLPVKHSLNQGLNEALVAVNGSNFIVNIFLINSSLALFNLLPIFPLDGGRILRALLSFKLSRLQATRVAARLGQFLAVSFVLLSIVSNQFVQMSPSLILISLFVFISAQAELRSADFSAAMDGHRVDDVLIKDFVRLDVNDPVSVAVEKLLGTSSHEFVVFDGEKIAGTLSRDEIIRALQRDGSDAKIADVMNVELALTTPDQSLQNAYEQMARARDRLLLVIDNGRLKGIVDADNILEFILTRRALAS